MKRLQITKVIYLLFCLVLTVQQGFASSKTTQKSYFNKINKTIFVGSSSQSFVSQPLPVSSENETLPIEISDEDKDEDGKKETENNVSFTISRTSPFSLILELNFFTFRQNSHFNFVSKTSLFIAYCLLRI
jgi:hypothetical protein